MGPIIDQLDALRHLNVSSLTHWADIILVTLLIYRLLLMIKGTQAWRIVFGIAGYVVILGLSKFLALDTLNYILDKATLLAPVAIAIIFLPELRQALEGFGKLLPQKLGATEYSVEAHVVEEIVAASSEMAEQRLGAIIVIERDAKLDSIISNGTPLDATTSAALLGAIFYKGNPLHDGAAVVRKGRIVAAACRLPLSESNALDSHVHMRHRAAVGATETNDCIAVVISEERGNISASKEGVLYPLHGSSGLREFLTKELRGDKFDGRERRRLNRVVRKRQAKPSTNSPLPSDGPDFQEPETGAGQ